MNHRATSCHSPPSPYSYAFLPLSLLSLLSDPPLVHPTVPPCSHPSAVPSSQHLINICPGFRSLSACRHLHADTCTVAQSPAVVSNAPESSRRQERHLGAPASLLSFEWPRSLCVNNNRYTPQPRYQLLHINDITSNLITLSQWQ